MKNIISFKRLLFILVLFFGICNLALAQEESVTQSIIQSLKGTSIIPTLSDQFKDPPKIEVRKTNTPNKCYYGVGKDCFKYEEIIGIENGNRYTALSIVQDVIYAATYMVGTVLTAVIIWCGLGYILASRGGKDTNAYKKGLKNAAIGAILVLGAYAIVRLIQYIAKG